MCRKKKKYVELIADLFLLLIRQGLQMRRKSEVVKG
jgi:hypothetical protein